MAQLLAREALAASPHGTPFDGSASPVSVDIEMHGHIFDSLLLSKVLNEVLNRGGSYMVRDLRMGYRQMDPSYARIAVSAGNSRRLQEILVAIHDHGAVPPSV